MLCEKYILKLNSIQRAPRDYPAIIEGFDATYLPESYIGKIQADARVKAKELLQEIVINESFFNGMVFYKLDVKYEKEYAGAQIKFFWTKALIQLRQLSKRPLVLL